MEIKLKDMWQLIKSAFSAWIDDFAPSMGAALAFYTAFSLAPLLLIVIAVAGLVFGQEAAQGSIVSELRGLIGEQGASAVQTMLKNASSPSSGIMATVIGVITLLIGATTVFNELQDDLNRIWKVQPNNGSGFWNLIRTRLLSFGMILGIGFLLLISLVVSAMLAALGKYWGGLFGGMEFLLHLVNFAISFGVTTVLFAMIYKILPSVRLAWRDVWIGAGVTALLFSIGKFLIGLYIGKSSVASAYGAAGAFVILLLWIYYSAQIFLLGAEFTKVYASRHGTQRAASPATPLQAPPRQRMDIKGAVPALVIWSGLAVYMLRKHLPDKSSTR